jgi:hypothetical protein
MKKEVLIILLLFIVASVMCIGGIILITKSAHDPPTIVTLQCRNYIPSTGLKRFQTSYINCSSTIDNPNTICNTSSDCVCDNIYCLPFPTQLENQSLASGCVMLAFGLLFLVILSLVFYHCYYRGVPIEANFCTHIIKE